MGNTGGKQKETDIEISTITNQKKDYEGLNIVPDTKSNEYTEIKTVPHQALAVHGQPYSSCCTRCRRAKWLIMYLVIFVVTGCVLFVHFAFPLHPHETEKTKAETNNTQNQLVKKLQTKLKNIQDDQVNLQLKYNDLNDSIAEQKKRMKETRDRMFELQMQFRDFINVNTPAGNCTEGWIRNINKCYFLATNILDWYHAKRDCESRNGKLAEPSTQTEIEFLRYTTFKKDDGNYDYWLGGTRAANDRDWLWASDKRLIREFGWSAREPSNYGGYEDCIEIRGNEYKHRWNDVKCTGHENRYICEKRL